MTMIYVIAEFDSHVGDASPVNTISSAYDSFEQAYAAFSVAAYRRRSLVNGPYVSDYQLLEISTGDSVLPCVTDITHKAEMKMVEW